MSATTQSTYASAADQHCAARRTEKFSLAARTRARSAQIEPDRALCTRRPPSPRGLAAPDTGSEPAASQPAFEEARVFYALARSGAMGPEALASFRTNTAALAKKKQAAVMSGDAPHPPKAAAPRSRASSITLRRRPRRAGADGVGEAARRASGAPVVVLGGERSAGQVRSAGTAEVWGGDANALTCQCA